MYDGDRVADRGDVFVVSLAYRLGLLGFLAHPALSAEAVNGKSGTYAILDLIAGLEWISDNIAAFGGDPDRVSIAGQSAGASNVCSLLASPLASGLFHGAVMQSGYCDLPALRSRLTEGEAVGNLLGCSRQYHAACLRAVPVDELLDAIVADPVGPLGLISNPARASVDGWVMRVFPLAPP